MKNYAVPLLLHLSLHTLAAAQGQVPTFNQRAPEEYIGDVTNDGGIGPNDINIIDTEGLNIIFGTELSKRVIDIGKAHCGNPEDEECQSQIKSALGIGPQTDGLQKRIVGLIIGGVAVAYVAYKLLSYVWNRLEQSQNFKVVSVKISKEEKEEASKWELETDEFLYKPFEGNPVTVSIDNNQPMVENPPKIIKEANGDITVTLPGIVAAIEAEWKRIIEPRNTGRSLTKRATIRQIVLRAQAIMRLAQLGGQGNQIRYISPLDFPKPKNELLVGALEEDRTYAKDMYLGGGLQEGARGSIADFATWIGFGYEVGNLRFDGDKMIFPSGFLELQEEITNGNCPQKDLRPFCKNCGGNSNGADTSNADTGKCVGLGEGEKKGLQGCECFVDNRDGRHGYTVEEAAAIFNYLRHLPDKGPDKAPELKRKQCWKEDVLRMSDHHNWKFVQQVPLDEAIKKYCDEWTAGESTAGVTDISSSKSYYNGEDDWNHVVLTIFQPKTGMVIKEQCHKWMLDISAGCDFDAGDEKKNFNQFNWKWGGEVELDNGVKFSISPFRERVMMQKRSEGGSGFQYDGHQCEKISTFAEKENKGLNGEPLNDKAKMALQMCTHQMRVRAKDANGWTEFDFSCGGLVKARMHPVRYNNPVSCVDNTWECISYYIDHDELYRGHHNPGFSDCWADLLFEA